MCLGPHLQNQCRHLNRHCVHQIILEKSDGHNRLQDFGLVFNISVTLLMLKLQRITTQKKKQSIYLTCHWLNQWAPLRVSTRIANRIAGNTLTSVTSIPLHQHGTRKSKTTHIFRQRNRKPMISYIYKSMLI